MLDFLLDGIPGEVDSLSPDTPVWCSEVLPMDAECRVYVVNGKVRAACPYKNCKDLS